MHYDSPCYVNQIEKFEYIFNNIKEFLYPNNNPNIKLKKYGKYFPLAKQVEPFGMKTKFYIHKNHYQDKNLWIAKASDLNRGRCIRMIDSIQMLQDTNKKFYEGIFKGFMRCENELKSQKDLKSSIEKNTKGKKEKSLERSNFRRYRTSSVLIQKYIENPLLYNGRKFDIRMWVMLSVSKDVYIFKEGHLKTSSENYSLEQIDSFIHLTNYSVQKHSPEFSKFEKGNEVSFDEFQNSLNKNYPEDKFNVRTDFINAAKEIVEIVFKSTQKFFEKSGNCFEIFGFDFILDKDFNVFLLEVNSNPGFEYSSPLIRTLLPRMIDDAFRLTIDKIFEPQYSNENQGNEFKSWFSVNNYTDNENIFDFVCKI